MNVSTNKKLNRTVHYHDDGTRTLYQGDEVVAEGVSVDEAHRWFHGEERHEDPVPPNVDEMIDAVAAKLKAEMADYMLWAVDNPEGLLAMYRAKRLTRGWW